MDDPEVYHKLGNMPRIDVKEILERNPIKWKKANARVLDIGCGDGSLTVNMLKKYMPDNFMKIVGCDISQKSVTHAQEHYGSEKIQFVTLDINEKVPDDLKNSFDHIFSSYTFHWAQQQETAFTNVYDMLVEGGSCLLIFLGRFTAYEVYDKLSRTPKWKEDLKDVHTKFISPYFNSQDPAREVRSLMERIGFKDVNVTATEKTHSYARGVDEFKKLMKCLNPFESLNGKWDDFMDDCVKLEPGVGKTKYILIEAYGVK